MYRKKQYIRGLVLSMASGIHWGSWHGFPVDTGGPMFFVSRALKTVPKSHHPEAMGDMHSFVPLTTVGQEAHA